MSLLLLLDQLPPTQPARRRSPPPLMRRGRCVTPPPATAALGATQYLYTTQTPTLGDVFENQAVTVAQTFTVSTAGYVTGGRFYAPATVSGTFELALYRVDTDDNPAATGTGTLLATAAFGTVTGAAWNYATFAAVAVTPGVAYRIGLRTSEGRYTATGAFFASADLVNGYLTGPQTGTDPVGIGPLDDGNFIESLSAYPNKTFNANAYFVDPAFSTVAADTPPFVPPSTRHPVVFRPRRRPTVAAPPASQQGLPAAASGPRPKFARPARARITGPIPAQATPAAPVWTPLPVRPRLKGLRLFRSRTFGPVAGLQLPPPAVRPVRARWLRPFRSRTVLPVPAQIAAIVPAYPPQPVRVRLRGLRLLRPRTATVVPAQVVVAPPPYPPAPVRTRLRGLRLFRGRAAAPVPAQVVVVPPAYAVQPARPRLKGVRLNRGRAAAPPMPVPLVPPPVRPRLKGLRLRPRKPVTPVPPQVVLIAPPFVPLFTRVKKRLGRIIRGHAATPVATPVVIPSSPNPELYTRSGGQDVATLTRPGDLATRTAPPGITTASNTRDLITRTHEHDLEA